ncbi:MAG: hypothetical protein M3310_01820, partial [Actinomycetota bacterium]|nr:hypothetical protein [Actinomycetota bacterium]
TTGRPTGLMEVLDDPTLRPTRRRGVISATVEFLTGLGRCDSASVESCIPMPSSADVGLGRESGFELARRIDAASSTLVPTSHGEVDVEDVVAGSGLAGFLLKPQLSASAMRRILGARAVDVA